MIKMNKKLSLPGITKAHFKGGKSKK